MGRLILILALALGAFHTEAAPGFGRPLDSSTGTVYRAGTATEIINALTAINDAGETATLLIADGEYILDTWALPVTCDDVIIRGDSGCRDAVILRGPDDGPEATLEHVFWVTASRVTLADLTFGWCRYHGIQIHGQEPFNAAGLRVHNCRIVNCNEQFIKGSSSDADPEGATDGVIEHCLFEFTSGWAYQAYTGGIDIHKGVNWIVRDNLFRYLRATDGLAEHAIHFWKRNTVRPQTLRIERNLIINCDRGIGLGLSSLAGGHNGGGSLIRNNMIFNDGTGPNTDVGIGLEYACDVTVDHNTVIVPYWAPIEYRFSGSSNLLFRNNLVNGPITARDGAPAAVLSNNLTTAQTEWFRDAAAGNLRLIVPDAPHAIDRGVPIADLLDDIDGETRPAGAGWDVGADEYDPANSDADGDNVPDADEWQAGTDPLDPTCFLRLEAPIPMPDGSGLIIRWHSAASRSYTLAQTTQTVSGAWTTIAAAIPATPPMNTHTNMTASGSSPRFYRVAVE